MLRTILNGRTVNCGEMKMIGSEDTEFITLKVATDRNYTKIVVDENGEEKRVKEQDFILCVAYGSKAKIINDYCNLYNAEGKFISRPVYIEGRLENFTKDEDITISEIVEVAGKKVRVTLTKTIKRYGTKLVIDTINFLSANPTNAVKKQEKKSVKKVEIIEDVKEEVKGEVKEEVKAEVKGEVKEEVKAEVKEEIKEETNKLTKEVGELEDKEVNYNETNDFDDDDEIVDDYEEEI